MRGQVPDAVRIRPSSNFQQGSVFTSRVSRSALGRCLRRFKLIQLSTVYRFRSDDDEDEDDDDIVYLARGIYLSVCLLLFHGRGGGLLHARILLSFPRKIHSGRCASCDCLW